MSEKKLGNRLGEFRFIPGALLGVVGGSGVLKGSKGTGSKLKEVVLEFGRGVIEVVDFSWLESKM